MTTKGVTDVMKKAKVLTATASLVAGLGVATTVQADEVDIPAQTTPVEEQSQSVTTTVTQEDVITAKEALDKANQDVANQEEVVKDAANKADQAQSEYDKAQDAVDDAQDLVNQATDEAKQEAADAIKEANQKLEEANNNQTAADNNLANAQDAVTKQEGVVSTAKEDVTSAQDAVDQAQKDVDTAQDVLDGTGSEDILDEEASAKADEATKKSELEDAKANLAAAQNADQKRQETINNAQNSLEAATKDVSDTKAELEEKTEVANKTQEEQDNKTSSIASAQSKVDSLTNEIANQNTIVLPDGYVDALNNYYTNKTVENSDLLTTVASSGLTLNSYKSNLADSQEVISDVNNLTLEQQNQLTLFTVDLLNQVRKAFGTPEVVANVSAIAFADEVANTSNSFAHDIEAIKTAAAKFGLNATGQYYENLSTGYFFYTSNNNFTMDELKSAVYNTVISMLFKDASSAWGHTTSLTGVQKLNTTKYIGIDLGILVGTSSSGYVTRVGQVHILGVADSSVYIEDYTLFDTASNLESRDLESELNEANQELNEANQELSDAQSANTAAQSELSSAQAAYNEAVAAQTTALTALEQAKAIALQTPTAQTDLEAAQTAYDLSVERLQKAEEAVATLTADVQVKQANLEAAKVTLAQKQEVLSSAQTNLAAEISVLTNLQEQLVQAKANVQTAKQAVDNAKVALTEAANYLATLESAPEKLAEAQANYEVAQANLLAALDQLEVELEILKDLQATQTAAQTVYDTTATAYQEVLDAQEKERIQSEYDALISSGKIPVAIVDETGKITGWMEATSTEVTTPETTMTSQEASNIPTVTPTSSQVTQTLSRVAKNHSDSDLPATGDKNSATALILGALLAGFGLVGLRRKQED